ncbi:nicotinate-nucleotide--dimethylbenzimidazole phosphoribosyltransferase [Methylibium sp.]|uniref:nicotinate-nucleotide--dimethylbenzimidazole phosphoribosyltransferase n=1 Tax=Methylibium sp. TaxID=2067992 RepID=UPI003D0E407D
MEWTPPAIAPLADAELAARLQRRIDHLTKPLGALGQLEALMRQIGLLQRRVDPRLEAPQALVFAADHGLAAHGVSAYPSEVTAQMVENFLAGGAAISVLARLHGLMLTVVDAGVRGARPARTEVVGPPAQQTPGLITRPDQATPALIARPVGPGTADACEGPAMSAAQCVQALELGREVVRTVPGNALLFGEMGIGNTSAAALLTARLTGAPLAACVGRGTGLDDAGLARKLAVLEQVAQRHAGATVPLEALTAFGGFEIAALAGAMLQAAHERRLIVVDGFIVTAALLVAHALQPAVLDACVFAHRSDEAGHARALAHLGARPLLALDLRLGEGSGAALAWPLIASAVALLNDMASFDSAGVSGREA